MRLACWFTAALCASLTACSPGSGRKAVPNSTYLSHSRPSMTVTALHVEATATTVQSAPTAHIQVYIHHLPANRQVFLSTAHTHSGIASLRDSTWPTPMTVGIQFKSPASLGPGAYYDIITLKACYERACTHQVPGSPWTVQVQYTVTAPQSQ